MALKMEFTNRLRNLTIKKELFEDFAKLEKYLSGFFMKKILGYSPQSRKSEYPFQVYLARHKAASMLEASGTNSGKEANCSSRK